MAEAIQTQTVKLKVLYTFDADQKDNHLARWPHSLQVPTDWVDEVTQIGVIDLRTCLEAITTASPEIVTKIDTDFTIYAYDYSEPGTPLVGQGTLSKALNGHDEQSDNDGEAMVTGKVTRGFMGLFAKNAQETLEVRLRLTPMMALPQQRTRSGSISTQDGLQQSWSTLTQVHNSNGFGLQSRPTSRPGTPSGTQSFNSFSRQPDNVMSRPSSRAGMGQIPQARRESFNSGYVSGDETVDDGPARKRARITKVDWPTKSSFNIERQPDSLRVVASTASSVRLHRPVPLNPTMALQTGGSVEEPVRPPTPIPTTKTGKPRGRPRKNPPSTLAQGTQVRDSSPAVDVAVQSELLDISLASPEDIRAQSVSSTPANIPSSPPLMPERPPAVTSPALPPMLDHHDSGFMSGNLDELFGDDAMLQFGDIMTKDQERELVQSFFSNTGAMPLDQTASTIGQGKQGEGLNANPQSYQIQPALMHAPPRPLSRAQSYAPASRVSMSSPKLAPAPIPRARQIMEEQRAARALLPQVPASDPVGRTLHRANTWAPDMSDALMSEAPSGSEGRYKSTKKKVGIAQNKARLEQCIATGEMPPYCDNCGAIETPAWRRAYARYYTCAWDEVETSTERGVCCYKEVLETNEDGSVKRFRGLKPERGADDNHSEWIQINLCNSCGLWFHKQKRPRPREKFEAKDPNKARKRKRARGSKSTTRIMSGPNGKSDAPTPMTDESSPAESATTEQPDVDEPAEDTSENEPQLPPIAHHMRANSAEPAPRGLSKVQYQKPVQREVRSSPGEIRVKETETIEIDFTPKPVRRQLFPSPDKPQILPDTFSHITTSMDIAQFPAFVRRSPRLNKTSNILGLPSTTIEITVDGKENTVPAVEVHDSLDDLFETEDDNPMPPSTPTPQRRSERLLFKTPSKTPRRQFAQEMSPNADHSPTFRRTALKHATTPAMAALLGSAVKKDITEMTPFSRSMYEAMSDAHELGLMTPVNATHSDRVTRSSKKNTPLKPTPRRGTSWEFADLTDLDPANFSADQGIDWDLPSFQLDEMLNDMGEEVLGFGPDRPIPSSPPSNFSNFINSDGGNDTNEEVFETQVIAQEKASNKSASGCPNLEASTADHITSYGLRRSPRKRS